MHVDRGSFLKRINRFSVEVSSFLRRGFGEPFPRVELGDLKREVEAEKRL